MLSEKQKLPSKVSRFTAYTLIYIDSKRLAMVVELMDNMEAMVTKLGRNKLDSDSKHDTSIDMICVNKEDDNEDVFGVDSTEAASEKEPKKASSVSIDVTKALVILGFSNWSDLDDQGKLYTHALYKYLYVIKIISLIT